MIGSLQPPISPRGAVPVKLKLICVESNFLILDKLRHFALKAGFSTLIIYLTYPPYRFYLLSVERSGIGNKAPNE